MTDLTAGKVFDRISMTWVDPAEHKARMEYFEELAFMRQGNQGELCTPMVITDGQKPLQSMTNGKIYDSKSEMRKEYKRAGVVEVGNDTPKEKPKVDWKAERKKREASLGKALSYHGFGA